VPPQRPPSDSPAATALAFAAAAAPPAASGAAGGAATVGGFVASAKLIKNATKAIMAVVRRLSTLRIARARAALTKTATLPGDIEKVVASENKREAEFRRRAKQRVESGMRLALRAPDPSARAAAVESVVRREQQYARQRAVASGERLFAAVEREALRRDSPRGAYWELGPTSEHTPDCVAMAGKLWPWEVLDKLHPPMHVGCKCRLRSYGEALAAGLLAKSETIPDLATAQRLAAPVISWVERETATENAAVAELLLREELTYRGDRDALAAMPLKADRELAAALAEADSDEDDPDPPAEEGE
jgi:hypothetical protein